MKINNKIILIIFILSSYIYSQDIIGKPFTFSRKYTKKELWDKVEKEVFDSPVSASGSIKNKGVMFQDYQGIFTVTVDKEWNRLIYMNRNDNWFKSFGNYGSGNGQFIHPEAVVLYDIDRNNLYSSGYVYVADTDNKRIVKLLFSFASKSISFISSFKVAGKPYDIDYSNNLTPGDLNDDVIWVMFRNAINKYDINGNCLDSFTYFSDGLNNWSTEFFQNLKAISVVSNREGNTYNDELYVIDNNYNKQGIRKLILYWTPKTRPAYKVENLTKRGVNDQKKI